MLPSMIASTPTPPYYAVIFTSIRTQLADGYGETAILLEELAHQQPGCLGMESARNAPGVSTLGITVSYWESLEAIRAWKQQADHRLAQQAGRAQWYETYQVRICRVERDYGFSQPPVPADLTSEQPAIE